MTNIFQKLNPEILFMLEDWDLVASFGAIGSKMVYLTKLCNPMSDFHKQALILFAGIIFKPNYIEDLGFLGVYNILQYVDRYVVYMYAYVVQKYEIFIKYNNFFLQKVLGLLHFVPCMS